MQVHPSTYLNKMLIGTEEGGMQLWNLKTKKMVYSFKGWGSPIWCCEQSPAVDVVAVGLVSNPYLTD
jgi:U3 small nucleolar RNA-associated protein 21